MRVEDPSVFANYRNCIVNPDLMPLRGIPPHYWKIQDGKIVEMTLPEKRRRDRRIKREMVDNSFSPPKTSTGYWRIPILIVVMVSLLFLGWLIYG